MGVSASFCVGVHVLHSGGAVALGTSSPQLLSSFFSKSVFAKALGNLLSENMTTHPSSSGSKKIGGPHVVLRTQARN